MAKLGLSTARRAGLVSSATLFIVLCSLVFHWLVYSTAVFFPHYLLDDLWLLRGGEPGYPGLPFIAIVQGRPVLWAISAFFAALHEEIGSAAVSLLRAQAICFLALYASLLFFWLRRWLSSAGFALVTAACLSTVPAAQMYVVGGPWFAFALPVVVAVPIAVYRLLEAHAGETLRRSWRSLAAALIVSAALLPVFAAYQSTAFVALATLSVPLLFGNLNRSTAKTLLLVSVLFFIMFTVYFSAWVAVNLLAGFESDGRYSPLTQTGSILSRFQELPQRLDHYVSNRWPMLGSLYLISPSPSHATATSYVLGLGFAASLVVHGSRLAPTTVARWAAALALLVLSDLPVFMSPIGSPVFSYMTALGPTFVLVVLVSASVQAIGSAVARFASLFNVGGGFLALRQTATAAVICCFGSFAAFTTAVYYVLPAWVERGLVRSQLHERLRENGEISHVLAYVRKQRIMSRGGYGEYQWFNSADSFYLHWLIRTILDEMDLPSEVRIDVRRPDGQTLTSGDYSISPRQETSAVVDLRGINLGSELVYESRREDFVPSPLGDPFLEEKFFKLHDAELIPAHVRSGSFGRLSDGAMGNEALVDGNLNSSAADPQGANPGTFVEVSFDREVALRGFKILTDSRFGVSRPQSMTAWLSSDGVSWESAGDFDLLAGMRITVTVELEGSPPASHLRITRRGGVDAADVWLSEIAFFGEP